MELQGKFYSHWKFQNIRWFIKKRFFFWLCNDKIFLIRLRILIFFKVLGTVHFSPGRKHPIMIINGFEYKLQLRNDARSNWCCTQDNKYRCKVRLMAMGNLIQIKDCEHTHEQTFKGDYKQLRSHEVTLEYTKKFRRAS